MKTPIGAHIDYSFTNDNLLYDGYVSFGQYIEDAEKDSFGIKDEYIFYYCHAGEPELKELISNPGTNDFKILSYELAYASENLA